MRILAILLALSMSVFFAHEAKSEQTVTLEAGVLTVTDGATQVMRVPGVPQGLSAFTAFGLVTGKLKETLVRDKIGEKFSSLDFSSFTSKTRYSDRIVAYRNGWETLTVVRRETEDIGRALGGFLLWIPMLLFAAATSAHVVRGRTYTPLFICYGVAILSLSGSTWVIAGAEQASQGLTIMAGAILGLVAGLSVSKTSSVAIPVLGGSAGGLIGGVSSIFGISKNTDAGLLYVEYLLAVGLFSFIFARVVKTAKEKWWPAVAV